MRRKNVFVAGMLVALLCVGGCEDKKITENITSNLVTQSAVSVKNDSEVEKQLQLLVEEREKWLHTKKMDDEEKSDSPITCNTYKYRVTDMDQNGRLEITSTTTNGNGCYFSSEFWEVNKEKNALVQIQVHPKNEDKSSPDIFGYDGYMEGYFDAQNEKYHYFEIDHTHGSATYNTDAYQDVCKKKNDIYVETPISHIFSGDKTYYYEGFFEKEISKKEFEKKMKSNFEQRMNFYCTDRWFVGVDMSKYYDEYEWSSIRDYTDEELLREIRESYKAFQIIPWDEKKEMIENLYFPTLEEGEKMSFHYTKNGKDRGILNMKVGNVRQGLNGTYYFLYNEKTYLDFEFWVTEHEIYEIEFDDYEEGALLFRGQIPKTHQLVCDKNGKDTNKEVAFKWEKGVGLTEYTGIDYDGNKITLQLVRTES